MNTGENTGVGLGTEYGYAAFFGGMPPSSVWKLPAEYYFPGPLTMQIVHPRPTAEASTNTWARQSNAYPGVEYSIPVTVQGGSFPFKYELTDALGNPGEEGTDYPMGMTIGETYGSTAIPNANYGILKWTPAAAGAAETVHVTVTDQDDNSETVTWDITPNTTNFVFFDITDTGSTATGTIDEPYNAFSDWLNTSVAQTKILYWRAGNYAHSEGITPSSTSPRVHLGYPGDAVILDISAGGIDKGDNDDTWWSNITLDTTPKYNPALVTTEANDSISEYGTGYYTVNKTGHDELIIAEFVPTSIIDNLDDTYTFNGAAGLPSLIKGKTTYLIVKGVTPAGLNGTWEIVSSSSTQATISRTQGEGDGTVMGTCGYGHIFLYDVVDDAANALNGYYAVTEYDANSVRIYNGTTGITASNAGKSAPARGNPKCLKHSSNCERWVVYDMTWSNGDFSGWKADDNAVGHFISNNQDKEFGSFINCLFTDADINSDSGGMNGGVGWDVYNSISCVFEGNTFHNINAIGLLCNIKQNGIAVSVRNNKITGTFNMSRTQGGIGCSGFETMNGVEFCYNKAIVSLDGSTETEICYNNSNTRTPNLVHFYRNTYSTVKALPTGVGDAEDVIADDNIILGKFRFTEANWNLGTGDDINYTDTTVTTGSFESDYTLTDAFLITISRSRGMVGHEIVAPT